jgi:hypothetical protein
MGDGKPGVPSTHGVSYAEGMALKAENLEMKQFMVSAARMLAMMRDVTYESLIRLTQANRLTERVKLTLTIQVATIDNILWSVMGVPKEAVALYRKERKTEEFEALVRSMLDKINPPLVLGATQQEADILGSVFSKKLKVQ